MTSFLSFTLLPWKENWERDSFPWPLLCLAFRCHGMIREWIRHECVFFSTRDVNSVKRRTTLALHFKHYIFISEDLRRAETLIFLITKVNSISLYMCFVSQSLRSAAAVWLCLQTGKFGLSPHAILAVLFRERKNCIKFGRNCVCRQKNFFRSRALV